MAVKEEERVRHPWFARAYIRSDTGADEEYRRELLSGLSGRVVEVGAGHGPNFALYPPTVSHLTAVEPEATMLAAARQKANGLPIAIDVVEAVAGQLPLADASVDAGVVSLVLCSVPEQARALSELFRVIRPGGELRFYEHVSSNSGFVRGLQGIADATVWPRIAGNCHLARDTGTEIEQAGFVIETSRRVSFSARPMTPPIPHILGRARRP